MPVLKLGVFMSDKSDVKLMDEIVESPRFQACCDQRDREERQCYCDDCRYCDAYLSVEADYETADYVCSRCGGGGCTRCEEE